MNIRELITQLEKIAAKNPSTEVHVRGEGTVDNVLDETPYLGAVEISSSNYDSDPYCPCADES